MSPRADYVDLPFNPVRPLFRANDDNWVAREWLMARVQHDCWPQYDQLLLARGYEVRLEFMAFPSGGAVAVADFFTVVDGEELFGYDVSLSDDLREALEDLEDPMTVAAIGRLPQLQLDTDASGDRPAPSQPSNTSPPASSPGGDPLLDAVSEPSLEPSYVSVTFEASVVSSDEVVIAFPALDMACATMSLEELGRMIAIDTGCSRHMTNQRDLLQDFLYFAPGNNTIPRVQMGSGPAIPADGMGTLQLFTKGYRVAAPEVPVNVVLKFPHTLLVSSLHLTLLAAGSLLFGPTPARAPTGHSLHFGGSQSFLELNTGVRVFLDHNLFNLFVIPVTASSAPPLALAAVSNNRRLWSAHAALGHANIQSVCALLDIPVPASSECTVCRLAKQKRSILVLPDLIATATTPGALLYIDITGPMPVPTRGGARYALGAIDACSGSIVVLLLKNRARLETALPHLQTGFLDLGIVIKDVGTRLFSDQEFNVVGVNTWCTNNGIVQLYSPSGEPRRNLMERAWLSLYDRVRAMLYEAQLPMSWWGIAFQHSVYLLNRTPTRRPGHAIPLAVARGRPLDAGEIDFIISLPRLGTPAAIFDPVAHHLNPAAVEGVFGGVQAASQSYRLFVGDAERFSVHVKFLSLPPSPGNPLSAELLQLEYQPAPVMSAVPTGPVGSSASGPAGPVGTGTVGSNATVSSGASSTTPSAEPSRSSTPQPNPTSVSSAPTAAAASEADLNGDDPLLVNLALAAFAVHGSSASVFSSAFPAPVLGLVSVLSDVNSDPKSYREALASPAAAQWMAAVETHMNTVRSFDTYTLISTSQLQPGDRPLRSHFIFKTKYNATTGDVDEHKARWVADGQFVSVDDDPFNSSVFAPVVAITSGRVLLAFAARHNFPLMIADVSSAFLQADTLTERVLVYLPKGYPSLDADGNQLVALLHKPLFGLPQSPRLWFLTLNRVLVTDLHLVQCPRDPCLYVGRLGTPQAVYLCITVDDLLLAATHQSVADSFLSALGERFKLSRLGPAKAWLGMSVDHDRSAGVLSLSLGAYIRRFLGEHGLLALPPHTTPMSPTVDLCHDLDIRVPLAPAELKRYQQLLGGGVYASTVLRFDFLLGVHKLAKHMAKPNSLHWNALLHLLGYALATSDLALTYCREGDSQLVTYVDASYPGDRDNRSSLSGGSLQYAGAAVAAFCKMQKVVVLSSAEAEYMALAMIIRRLLVLLEILAFLGEQQDEPSRVLEDNQPTIRIANNSLSARLSNHIDVRAHYIRQVIASGRVVLEYCPTADNIADMFTKPLARMLFRKFRALVMGCDLKPARRSLPGCQPPLSPSTPPVSSEPSRVALRSAPPLSSSTVDTLGKPTLRSASRVRFTEPRKS